MKTLVPDHRVGLVAFTGSVAGGRAVQEAAATATGFKGVNLELGGKDPAYVREDADVKYTAEQLVDGKPGPFQVDACSVVRSHVQLWPVM